jgi:carboxymethylenebutenolidase
MNRWIPLFVALAMSTPALAQTPPAGAPGQGAPQTPAYTPPKNDRIPPGDPYVDEALKSSPRKGQWVDVKLKDGTALKSWVVMPAGAAKTGVVIVVHENRGINDWTRAVADQAAEDGFIGIAPDLLSGKGPNGGGTDSIPSTAIGQAIAALAQPERNERLDAVMAYGKTLPTSNGKTAVVGFCWGGGTVFAYAGAQPALSAVASYYGPIPDAATLEKIGAPVLGLYGENDSRITLSVPAAADKLKSLGKSFESHVYPGAAHAFMHQRSEADYKASEQSWPAVIAFFKDRLK